MFKPEEIPWEIWTIKIEQMQLSSENERQFMREKLSDTLTERVFQITEIM
jgi:autophagy-related protein 101